MKRFLPLALSAATAVFSFTACDKEKTDEAKTKTVEAAKATGEVVKDTTGRVLDKTGDLFQKAGEKIKGVREKLSPAAEKIQETPAMEKFKTGLNGFSTMMTNMKEQAGSDLAKAKQMTTELKAKFDAVSTEGVPDDVKKAYQDYRAIMGRVLKLTANMPTEPAAAEQYFKDHAEEGARLEKDSQAAGKALREAAAKHGLTNLDLGEGEQ